MGVYSVFVLLWDKNTTPHFIEKIPTGSFPMILIRQKLNGSLKVQMNTIEVIKISAGCRIDFSTHRAGLLFGRYLWPF
jgi:hypothetical protein